MASKDAGGGLVAWEQMMVVRQSNLYEHKGLAKPLLALIALLTIGPPAEGKEPDKDEGFCVATQAYLAASLGCSDTEVKRLTKIFETDGWIQVIRYRDHRGYQRNRYRIVDVEKIKERAMQRDPETHEFIRGTSPNKRRTTSWVHGDTRESSGQLDMEHEGTLIPGLGARCADPEGTVPPVVGFKQVNSEVRNREIPNPHSLLLTHNSNSKQNAKPQGTSSPEPQAAKPQGTSSPEPPAAAHNPPNSDSLPAPTAKQFIVDWNSEERSEYLSHFPEEDRPAITLMYEFKNVTGEKSLREDFAELLSREDREKPNQSGAKYISHVMRWAVNDSDYWQFHNSKHFCSESTWSEVRRQYEQSKKKSKTRTRRRGPYMSIKDNDNFQF